MDDGCLKAIKQQTNTHRKFLYIANSLLKNSQDSFIGYLNKQQRESELKFRNDISSLRKTLSKQKILRRCLDDKRRVDDCFYGHYGGVSLGMMSRDVEEVIAHNTPKLRRLRTIEGNMIAGLSDGRILSQDKIDTKMYNLFKNSI
ncbi:hypothetical protein SNE40_000105 [Patella caerulea]|uniref:Uncharacterized protein n=1 Tax=Patella caerulea TaxID=87958 RepID=A0AAN8KIU4_PATCE